jgi:hypothetical protein
MDSSQKGDIAVLKVQIRAREKGAECYMPLSAASRFDMALYWCGRFYRVQIKYGGRTRECAPGVAIVGLTKGDHGEKRYTSDEIDALLVYVVETDEVCWFGPEIFHGKTMLYIRHAECKNGRKAGCIMLENYIW